MDRPEGRSLSTRYDRTLRVVVDRPRARFGSWYEIFPRSWGKVPGRHASFRELEDGLPYIASMGFDVLYLTPIHPIARTHRKGRNNALVAGPDDPGSPWAIGSPEGGHKAIHPQLGTLDDFRHFLLKAKEFGLEIALDIALHCSPDHPYVKEHPEWFRRGPDGTIRYAENPPKKYEDIYPLDFESPQAEALWTELKSIFEFWMAQGVKIFRIDNPHTKPFAFWEWLIADLKRQDPEVLFLSEAFTRPKVMMRLAKLGFSQSYTYFCWRTTRKELTDYFTELTQTSVREYFRPSVWPNTPDILIGYLQTGGPAAFQVRLILAATLAATYGIYGPAFELCEHTPREPGSEEYLNSEKYEIKAWDLDAPTSLREWIARVNRIRRDHPALQRDDGLQFHSIDNDQLICYSKRTPSNDDRILVVVNLDPHHAQSGWTDLRLEELDLRAEVPFRIKDLLTGNEYTWHGPKNFVHLDPQVAVAHLFHVMGP
jgi:starch synthase (maltosyl-transferring)